MFGQADGLRKNRGDFVIWALVGISTLLVFVCRRRALLVKFHKEREREVGGGGLREME